jgi:hypothetical protein
MEWVMTTSRAGVIVRAERGFDAPAGSDPATHAARVAADVERWTRVIRAAGIRSD